MCEALIYVHSQPTTGNKYTDCRLWQQGFVVTVQNDGFTWGDCEICGAGTFYKDQNGIEQPIATHINGVHAFWRIGKFPLISVSQAQILMGPELPVDPQNPSPYLQLRAYFMDKTKIQTLFPNFYAYLIDDLRTNPSITVDATPAQVQSIITQVTPIPFP